MKPTKRTERINASINKAYPQNNDEWWVSNEYSNPHSLVLHRGRGEAAIRPADIARTVFRSEKSVKTIFNNYNYETYTRKAVAPA